MAMLRGLGELERAVMDQLWGSDLPQTVREVHSGLLADRELAYTTVMTVLQRLHCKNLVVQPGGTPAGAGTPGANGTNGTVI